MYPDGSQLTDQGSIDGARAFREELATPPKLPDIPRRWRSAVREVIDGSDHPLLRELAVRSASPSPGTSQLRFQH